MKKVNIHARKKARQFALQALYQWRLSGNELSEIEAQYAENKYFKKADTEYFNELLYGIPNHVDVLDAHMIDVLDRSIEELNPVELTALRIAIYELEHRPEIPYRVVINEALELTKMFGSIEGYKFVNGVLDKVAKVLRKDECSDT